MTAKKQHRYGMVIDVDRCTGCGACMVACSAENNVAPTPARATERTRILPLRIERVSNGANGNGRQDRFLPVLCMQCGHDAPCVSVCPQHAVEVDRATGIVFQMPQRCLGCRYCMTACPYHARSFNWWDPEWPAGMQNTLNPDVSPRMRGVVEKCNFCHGRLHAAQENGSDDYTPACAEACPTQAITFGDLADPSSEVAHLSREASTFRLLPKLGTEPKVYYRSEHAWVRQLAERGGAAPKTGGDRA
jgi:Fe-S-cluster-containing dehydrogenase component